MAEEFPYLDADKRFRFPEPTGAGPEGIVGAGGNLSPGMLLSAYEQGIFPWYSGSEPILWWSPDPRFVLYADRLHVPKRLERTARKAELALTVDRDFDAVIDACSRVERPGQEGTWITDDMLRAYRELHRLGYAHSCEVYQGSELVGGLYGVSLGDIFFGESMFSLIPDASKIAFVRFARALDSAGFRLVDCQVYTEHLARFGAEQIPRSHFLQELERGLQQPTWVGAWHELLSAAPQ
jgi:leucyl/phenylalanyl-tRNA--protein transferase